MKLIILSAVKDWIINKYGADKWKEIATNAGIGVDNFNNQDSFISDSRFAQLVEIILSVLRMEEAEFKQKFIEFWMVDFAPRVYMSYTKKISSTKQFLTSIIRLNNDICKLLPNNIISRIDMQEMDGNSLTLIYASEKSLVDVVGLLRGASAIFSDTYNIKKINPHSVEIKFDKK